MAGVGVSALWSCFCRGPGAARRSPGAGARVVAVVVLSSGPRLCASLAWRGRAYRRCGLAFVGAQALRVARLAEKRVSSLWWCSRLGPRAECRSPGGGGRNSAVVVLLSGPRRFASLAWRGSACRRCGGALAGALALRVARLMGVRASSLWSCFCRGPGAARRSPGGGARVVAVVVLSSGPWRCVALAWRGWAYRRCGRAFVGALALRVALLAEVRVSSLWRCSSRGPSAACRPPCGGARVGAVVVLSSWPRRCALLAWRGYGCRRCGGALVGALALRVARLMGVRVSSLWWFSRRGPGAARRSPGGGALVGAVVVLVLGRPGC